MAEGDYKSLVDREDAIEIIRTYIPLLRLCFERICGIWTDQGLVDSFLRDKYPFDKSFNELTLSIKEWYNLVINKLDDYDHHYKNKTEI